MQTGSIKQYSVSVSFDIFIVFTISIDFVDTNICLYLESYYLNRIQ